MGLQENQGQIGAEIPIPRDKVITSGKVGRIRRLDRENRKNGQWNVKSDNNFIGLSLAA
jgi:hypothetical protein